MYAIAVNGSPRKGGNTEFLLNTVLDEPQVEEVITPLVKNLLARGYIHPYHSTLGFDIDSSGLTKARDIPLAVLGRLTMGSVFVSVA